MTVDSDPLRIQGANELCIIPKSLLQQDAENGGGLVAKESVITVLFSKIWRIQERKYASGEQFELMPTVDTMCMNNVRRASGDADNIVTGFKQLGAKLLSDLLKHRRITEIVNPANVKEFTVKSLMSAILDSYEVVDLPGDITIYGEGGTHSNILDQRLRAREEREYDRRRAARRHEHYDDRRNRYDVHREDSRSRSRSRDRHYDDYRSRSPDRRRSPADRRRSPDRRRELSRSRDRPSSSSSASTRYE